MCREVIPRLIGNYIDYLEITTVVMDLTPIKNLCLQEKILAMRDMLSKEFGNKDQNKDTITLLREFSVRGPFILVIDEFQNAFLGLVGDDQRREMMDHWESFIKV